MRKFLLSILAWGIFVAPAYANPKMKRNGRDGIVRVKSTHSVAETAQRFESFAKKQGYSVNII